MSLHPIVLSDYKSTSEKGALIPALTPALEEEQEIDFIRYTHQQVIKQKPANESQTVKVARYVLNGIAIVAGPLARLPFLAVPLKFGGEGEGREVYGVVLAVSNTLSYGLVISWCLTHLITRMTVSKSEEEKRLMEFRMGCCARTLLKTVAVATGVLSRLPFAYIAYHYNDNNIFYPIPVLLIDSAYPIYSLFLSGEQLANRRCFNRFDEELKLLKKKLILCLKSNQNLLVDRSISTRDAYLEKFQLVINREDLKSVEQVRELFKVLCQAPKISQNKNKFVGIGRTAAKGLGYGLGIIQSYFIHTISYACAEELVDDTASRYAISVGATLCGAYLGFNIMKKTCVRTYNFVLNKCLGKTTTNLSDIVMPKLKKSLELIGFIVVAFSYAPPLQVCMDYYTGNFQIFMGAVTVLETIMVASFAISDLINEFVQISAIRWGSQEARQLVHVQKQLRQLIDVVRKCPLIEFALLVKVLPEECYKQLTEGLEIKLEDLDRFLASTSG